MRAVTRELYIERGATFVDEIIWKAAGEPVDLTGATAKWQVRAEADATVVLLEASTADGRITLNTVPGQVRIEVPASVTSEQSWQRGVHAIEITMANGFVRRLYEGKIKTSKEVVRE